jgi:hypothetical protein
MFHCVGKAASLGGRGGAQILGHLLDFRQGAEPFQDGSGLAQGFGVAKREYMKAHGHGTLVAQLRLRRC